MSVGDRADRHNRRLFDVANGKRIARTIRVNAFGDETARGSETFDHEQANRLKTAMLSGTSRT